MQVHELVELGRFLKTFIQERQLASLYQQLIAAINQAAQNQNPQQVRVLLQKLRDVHAEAEERVLSPAQRRLLSDFGAEKLLGRRAGERLSEAFERHQANPQGLVSEVQVILNETNELVKRANQVITTLDPMLAEVHEKEAGEDEGRLWLYFDNAASVNTIEDLQKAADTWKQVLHHFSRLPDASGHPARILLIKKYSPLELELAAKVALLAPLAFGIKWVLSRVEHVIKICQEAEKLKQLKVKTKIIRDLRAHAEEERKKITSEAADEIKKQFKGDDETRNAVEQALKKIVLFIEGGGQLDIDVGEAEVPSEEGELQPGKDARAGIQKLIESIRRDFKLLPSHTGEGTNDEEEEDAVGD